MMNKKNRILEGKVAVVLGGEGLLGGKFCKVLYQNGAEIISGDIKLNFKENCIRKFKYVDVRDEVSVRNFIFYVLKNYNKIDLLINSFAINPQVIDNLIKFENYSLKDWKETIDINLTGTFLCCKEFGRVMNIGSVIVNVCSELGLFAPDQDIYENYIKPADYGASKAGVINLTKYLASYWKDKIRINNLVLGSVYNNQNEDFVLKISKKILLKRMANKNEYNEALLFLCSDASSYMTGQNLIINGGRGIMG